jgi:hypothetical protein
VQRAWAHPLPHLHWNWAHPLPHLRRDWAHPLPHLRRDWARPCHICAGLGSLLLQAIEILSVLIVYYIVAGNIEYGSIGLLTWSMWFVAVCWIFTPFWFNPLAFDWSKTLCDF